MKSRYERREKKRLVAVGKETKKRKDAGVLHEKKLEVLQKLDFRGD